MPLKLLFYSIHDSATRSRKRAKQPCSPWTGKLLVRCTLSFRDKLVKHLAPVVQRADNFIYRISRNPAGYKMRGNLYIAL